MSTDLLQRKMDLEHHFYTDGTNYGLNTLTMDTSYPVKLSGVIVKVFKAKHTYVHTDKSNNEFSDDKIMFKIQNEKNETILQIPKKNVFDFAKNPFPTTEKQNYKEDDYVLAIIDFNDTSTDTSRNNGVILIHTLHGISGDVSIYDKYFAYYCNGKNDNVVLGDIINIITDLYGYNQDLVYNQKEFEYIIKDKERKEIYENNKITIEIIGKFGIDYSQTDFVYGKFNRQNRSTIMKISGYSSKTTNNVIEEVDNKDMELVLDFKKCYIPKIDYDSNEKYAALYNTRLIGAGVDEYVDYWQYNDPKTKSKSNHAHFRNPDTGRAYGNLFPRRLVFMSVEGILPLNITIKNMCVTSFGVGVYCEIESNKMIKIEDCKFTVLNAFDRYINSPMIGKDINTEDYYKQFKCMIPFGCAIDINCFNAKVDINNTKIRNGSNVYTGELIMNSSKNMRISNCDILGFSQYKDSYKYAYTFPYLDYDFNPDFHFEIKPNSRTFTNTSNIDTSKLSLAQCTDFNYLEVLILNKLFYNVNYISPSKRLFKYNDMKDYLSNNGKVISTVSKYTLAEGGIIERLYSHLSPLDLLSNKNDRYQGNFFTCLNSDTTLSPNITEDNLSSIRYADILQYSNLSGKDVDKNEPISRTCGIIKNLPITFKDAYYSIEEGILFKDLLSYNQNKNNSNPSPANTYFDNHFNQQSRYQPCISLINSRIESDGLIYQVGGSVNIDNCTLNSKLYDYSYQSCQINIVNGVVNISNCKIDFDTVMTRNGTFLMNWIGTDSLTPTAFIRISPNQSETTLSILNELKLVNYDISSKLNNGSSIYTTYANSNISYGDFAYFIYGCAVKSSNRPMLNIVNTDITTHVDSKFNIINSTLAMPSKEEDGFNTYVYTPDCNISDDNKMVNFKLSQPNSPKLTVIYSNNYRGKNGSDNYFNPLVDPVINISSTNFYFDNSFSLPEYSNLGDSSNNNMSTLDMTNSNALGIIAKVDTAKMKYKNLSIFSGTSDDFKNKIFTQKDEIYTGINLKNLNLYHNIITEYTRSKNYGSSLNVFNDTDRVIIHYFNLDNGIIYHFDITKESSTELKIVETETTAQLSGDTDYEKLISMGATNYYQFFEHLSTSSYKGVLSFTKIYGSDLSQTGYYIHNNITDYLAHQSNNNINPARALVDLNSSVFDVSNVVMNVNNCNIGGTPNAIRNTYNGETFVKHCPRVAFQLESNGIYNISNTNAYAWATVLWSNLTDSITSVFNRQTKLYNPGNNIKYGVLNDTLDKSTIDMSKGSCVVDNCNFINCNASRFYYNKTDKITLLSKGSTLLNENNRLILKNTDTDNNKYLDKFVYNDINNKTNTIIVRNNDGLDKEYRNYNEAYLNANEMPIIFINNLDQVRTEINNSMIRGNEIFIACGSVKVDSSTIINNNNALLFYLYKKTISSTPSLLVKNSKLFAIKDVIDNRYIDHNKRRNQYTNNTTYIEEPFYDDDTNTGYKLTEDKVIAIYGLMNNKISLINNDIEFKCNRYGIDCGIDYRTSIRFILANQRSIDSNNLSEVILDGNTFDILFDGGTTSGGYTIIYPENITNTNNIRTVPSSQYLSVLEISSQSISNSTPNHIRSNTIIKNNDFNIGSMFLSGCKYIYPFYRTTAVSVSKYVLKKRHDLNSLYTVKQPYYDNLIDFKLPAGTKQNIDCKLNISCRYDLVIENCEIESLDSPPNGSNDSINIYYGRNPNKIYAYNPYELDFYSAVIKDENNKQTFTLNITDNPDYYKYYNITYSVVNDFDTLSYTDNDTINLYTALDTYQIRENGANEKRLEEIKSNTYMITNFNTPILFIEFDGKNKFVDTNIIIKDNTFYNGGISAGKQVYDDQETYNSYIKQNVINTGSTTGIVLNSPCILDISPLWTPTKEEFEWYNSFTVLNSNIASIDAYKQHKGLSIIVSDNTFIGNRSQAYYYKGLLTVTDDDKKLSSDKCQYTLKYHDKDLNMDIIDECLLFKDVNPNSNNPYDFKVLNKLHSTGEIEQKYYKTKLDTGLRDQFLNGYTFTNSYAIKINSRMTNNFFTLADLKNIVRDYTGNLSQDIGLGGDTRVYTKDDNDKFTYINTIKNLYPDYQSELHFRLSPNESSINDNYWKNGVPSSIESVDGVYVNDLSSIKVPVICKIHTDGMKSYSDGEEQDVKNELKSWETVGWVSISDVRLFYQVEMVKAHSHLIEPINGHVMSMKGYWGDETSYPNDWYKSWVETFANKGFSNTNPISVSTQGSSYSPLAAANSFGIDYTNYTNNISIKNNSFLYDNMQTMNKADNESRILPMNKERFRRMLLDIAGDL